MNARDKRNALQRMTLQALIAIAAHGGRFYDSLGLGFGVLQADTLASHVAGWQASIAAAVCVTISEAHVAHAFSIREIDGSREGYELIRFGGGTSGSGLTYAGETFHTPDTMWAAMRTIADLLEHPACVTHPTPRIGCKPRSIVVVGRRHFMGGNTYHTAEIVIDGVSVHRTARAPGYGNDYETSAAEWLQSAGLVTRERYAASGGVQTLARACEAAGIAYTSTACDVARRKDLT